MFNCSPHPEASCLISVRICYDSFKRSDSRFCVYEINKPRCYKMEEIIEEKKCINIFDEIKMGENDLKRLKSCIQLGHLGVIEGPHASFLIRGVSRSFSHQFVRHRLFSFCQRSQRYCNEENFGCILPDDILESKLKDEYIEHVEKTRILYTKSIKDGNIKKESARSILNNGTETELTCSGNFRTYFEYLTKRAFNPHAQDEHREVALIIYKELKQISPNIFNKENFKYYVPEKDHKEIPE